MTRKYYSFICVVLLTASSVVAPIPSIAQNMLAAQASGQPLIYTDKGDLRGCGLRAFAVYVNNDLSTVAVDTSVNIYSNRMFAFKGEVSDISPPNQGRKSRPVQIDSIWVKAPNQDATQPIQGKVAKGESGYSLLYYIPLDTAIAVIISAMKGESLVFGFKRAGRNAEHVYFGVPKLEKSEAEQLNQCIGELVEKIK